MKLNIKTKNDLVCLVKEQNRIAFFYKDQQSYDAAWHHGFSSALCSVFDSLDEIYQIQRMEHAIEDAKNHLYDYVKDETEYGTIIHSGIPEIIAARFLDNYDCNVAENDQYESIIEQVLKENGLSQSE